MSDAKFKTYLEGPGNMVTKGYQNSDKCDGTFSENIILYAAKGMCIKQSATASAIVSWDEWNYREYRD